jgi:hypothetical protein
MSDAMSVEAITEIPVQPETFVYPLFEPVNFTVRARIVPNGLSRRYLPWLGGLWLQPFGILEPDRLTQRITFPLFGGFVPGGIRQMTTVSPMQGDRSFSVSSQTSVCGDRGFEVCVPVGS